jgi:hypothetical protein
MTKPHDLDELGKGFERALRIRIWNECKGLGMRDDDCYKRINAEIEAIKAEVEAESLTRSLGGG